MPSSVAHAAVSKLREPFFADVVLRQQFASAVDLILRRFPFHIVNLILRSEVGLGSFVAIETPAHIERMRFPGERHFIDATVAGRAANAFLNVDAVIEKNEIGSLVDSLPVEGLTCGETFADWREHWRIGPQLRMATHAGVGWRNSGEGGRFNGVMAISAVDAEAADVMLVTEWDLLDAWNIHIGCVGRQVNGINHAPETEETKDHPCQ